MGIYKAYTDVSIKNGKAFHSYCLFDQKDNFIKGKVFRSDVKGSTQGEEYSIQTLIMDLKKERIENVKIYTDHLGMRMQKEKTIHKEIEDMKGEIIWIPRCKNKLADKACKSRNVNFFEKGILLSIQDKIKKIKKPSRLYKGDITIDNIKKEEKRKMAIMYRKIVQDLDKVTIDEILKWAEDKETLNTRKGRQYLLKCFIMEKYSKFLKKEQTCDKQEIR